MTFQLLFDDHDLSGFVWQHFVKIEGGKWEHPTAPAILGIVDRCRFQINHKLLTDSPFVMQPPNLYLGCFDIRRCRNDHLASLLWGTPSLHWLPVKHEKTSKEKRKMMYLINIRINVVLRCIVYFFILIDWSRIIPKYTQPVSFILFLSKCWIIGSSPLLFAMFTSLFNCKISHELVWVPNNLFMRFSLLHLALVFPELPHTSRKFLIGNCFIWKPQRVQGNSVTHWSYDKPSIRVDSEENSNFALLILKQ